MSVPNDESRIQHVGNNSTVTPYQVPFRFIEAAHLVVVVTDEDGINTVLTLGSDYTVTGVNVLDGGTVTTTEAVPVSSLVTIYREVPATQTVVFVENAKFPAKTEETALDKLTMLSQQVVRAVRRSYRVRESDGDIGEVAAVANTILGLSATKQPRTFTGSELASFLNLTQQYFDRPMKTFADAGERALAVPEFTGQLGTQRDNLTVWISDGITAGDWTLFDIVPGAGEIITSMLADGILSADGTGRGKMADSFITLAKIGAGIFTADATGRGKFAAGFVDSSLLAAGVAAANLPSGAVLQTVHAQTSTEFTCSTAIPNDNSVPQSTEGDQILTATITPSSNTSKVLILLNIAMLDANGAVIVAMPIFRGGTSAIATCALYVQGSNYPRPVSESFLDSPASASAVTYTVRVGPASGIAYVNRSSAGSFYGGTLISSIRLLEIKA